jgi:selenocysteine-specific elongation factor
LKDLVVLTNLADKVLENTLQKLMSDKIAIQTERSERRFIHASTYAAFRKSTLDILTHYHRKNPLKGGMSKGELRSKFPEIKTDRLFNQLLGIMLKAGEIEQVEDSIRLSGHRVTLKTDMTELKNKILAEYDAAGLQPPTFKDLCSHIGADPGEIRKVLMHLVDDGKLVKVKEDLFFNKEAFSGLKARLVEFLVENEDINTSQFKELTGTSRKYTIPLLEYFDAASVTLRVGDVRKLRRKPV